MSRSDVTLHDANKHDDDSHANGSATGNGAGADGDAADSDQQNKSCWSFLMCCFATKKTPKAKDPAYEDGKSGDKKNSKNEAGITMVPNKPDEKKADAGSGGGLASLATQVSQGSDGQVVLPPPPAFTNIRPPAAKCLLGPLADHEKGMKTLVLDLDETLVHSSFKPIANPDFVISIELENVIHRVYVLKRPGVDQFLRAVGQKFEVVVFTASLAKYADPLLDILDRSKVVKTRLFREACVHHYGNYVKDLSHLGRRLEDTIIIDNSPFSYMFQPDNAIPISSWFNDKNDRQLYELLPFLDQLTTVDDVCTLLHARKQQQLAAGTNMA